MNVCTGLRKNKHTHTHTHTRTHTHIHTHTRTHTHAHTRTYTHMVTYTMTHNTMTHTNTHTHTNTGKVYNTPYLYQLSQSRRWLPSPPPHPRWYRYRCQCVYQWMYVFILVCVCTNMYEVMVAGVYSPFCHGVVKYTLSFVEQRCPNDTPGAPSKTDSDCHESPEFPPSRGSGDFWVAEVFAEVFFFLIWGCLLKINLNERIKKQWDQKTLSSLL